MERFRWDGPDTTRKAPRTPAQLAEIAQQVRERQGQTKKSDHVNGFSNLVAYLGGIPKEAAQLIASRFAELEARIQILEAGQKSAPITEFDRAEKRKR